MAFPSLEGEYRDLISIPGFPPNLSEPHTGCLFRFRCPFRQPICREEDPPMIQMGPVHHAKCHFAGEADELRQESVKEEIWESVQVQ